MHTDGRVNEYFMMHFLAAANFQKRILGEAKVGWTSQTQAVVC